MILTFVQSREGGSGSGSADSPHIYPVIASPIAKEGKVRPNAAKTTVATAGIMMPHIGIGIYRAMAMPIAKATAGIKAGCAMHRSCRDCDRRRIVF